MVKRWLIALGLVSAALLAPHDGVAEKADGQTIWVGDRFFHEAEAEIGPDGALKIRCGPRAYE